MEDKNLIQAFDMIANSSGKGWFKGPMPEWLIQKAEKYLQIKFPISFREFLKEKGNGFFNGVEFYGLVNDNFSSGAIPNAIWLTMNERKETGLSNEFILVCESLDYFYAIDTAQSIDGENPIVDVIPGVPKNDLKIVAPSYGDFFLAEVKSVLW